jgi:hypothetical protein
MRTIFLLGLMAMIWLPAEAASREALRPAGDAEVLPLQLSRGAELAAVLAALGAAAPGVVVADTAAVPGWLSRELRNPSRGDLLERVSLDFDRAVLVRGSSLMLQLRYSHPEEPPALEIEEIQAWLRDTQRLLQPFTPRIGIKQYTRAQNQFVETLTPQQRELLRTEGIRAADLPPEQRDFWFAINGSRALGMLSFRNQKMLHCFNEWSRATLHAPTKRGERYRQLVVRFSYPPDPGEGVSGFPVPPVNFRPGRAQSERYELPEMEALPARSSLAAIWTLPLERLTLRALVERLAAEGGPEISFPEYAAERTLWVGSRESSRHAVLTAVADLWGWQLEQRQGRWRLGRPRAGPVRDPLELREELLRALPPRLRFEYRAVDQGATDRWGRQAQLVIEEAERVAGGDWEDVRISRLSLEGQQRLANIVAWRLLAVPPSYWFDDRKRVPAWVARPAEGVLHLSGEIGPGLHPVLSFRFETGEGKVEFWGWTVGSSSIVR